MSPATARRRTNIWVPTGLVVALKHRCTEVFGLLTLIAGGGFAAALLSYDPADPSLNHIIDRPPDNLLGHTGASVADLVLTTVGLAAAILVLAVLVWGVRLIGRHEGPGPARRVALLLASVPMAAVVLAAVAPPSAWPLTVGLGGLIGDGIGAILAGGAVSGQGGATPAFVGALLAIPALLAVAAPERLLLISAVLSKRMGLKLFEQDIFVNVVGGMKIDEPASDLATAIAIASSYYDRPVPADMAFIGELGLSGEIRTVNQMAMRLNEAAKIGFKRVVMPRLRRKLDDTPPDLEIINVRNIADALRVVLPKED